MEQKTKVFIDLDDTILDSYSLKGENYRLFNDILENTGRLSRSEFNEMLSGEFRTGSGAVFTPSNMVEALKRKGYATEGLRQRHEEMIKSAGKYFKSQVYDWIVKKFPKEKYKHIIYSYGDPDFQHEKLTACGIEKEFDQVIYINTDKVESLQKYIGKDEKFVLFEDKFSVVEGVYKLHPQATLYHVDGLKIKKYSF